MDYYGFVKDFLKECVKDTWRIPLKNCEWFVEGFLKDSPKNLLGNGAGFVKDILKDFFMCLLKKVWLISLTLA